MPQTAAQLANLNRKGRPKGCRNKESKVRERVRRSASAAVGAAMKTLREIVSDPSASNADRIRAAALILDRAIGRARTAVELGISTPEVPSLTLKEAAAQIMDGD